MNTYPQTPKREAQTVTSCPDGPKKRHSRVPQLDLGLLPPPFPSLDEGHTPLLKRFSDYISRPTKNLENRSDFITESGIVPTKLNFENI
jgi:hypothetical protein